MKHGTPEQYSKINGHPRVKVAKVLRIANDDTGAPYIATVATINILYPTDGAGRLRVAVMDHNPSAPTVFQLGSATGYGYDKLAGALDGCKIGGFTLGDHCDRNGNPTLRDLVYREGWTLIGG